MQLDGELRQLARIAVSNTIRERINDNELEDLRVRPLTHTEQRVWQLQQEGRNRQEIAAALGCKEATVTSHLREVAAKLRAGANLAIETTTTAVTAVAQWQPVGRTLVELAGVPASIGGRELTVREREVLALVAEGHSNEEIGELLHVSKDTVKTHMKHVVEKAGARNRTHAVALALRTHPVERLPAEVIAS